MPSGFWLVKNPPANAGDSGSIPGSGWSPGGGNGNPLQYSYQEKISWIEEPESENVVTQSCLTPWNPMDCSLPGCSVHVISQPTTLEWVAISFSKESSWPRDQTWVSLIAGRCSTIWATREALTVHEVTKSQTWFSMSTSTSAEKKPNAWLTKISPVVLYLPLLPTSLSPPTGLRNILIRILSATSC